MTTLRGLLLLPLLLLSTPLFAVIETYEFSDVALQERYLDLSAELRCPKCQNQNIADSNAPIAQDLRRSLVEQQRRQTDWGTVRRHRRALRLRQTRHLSRTRGRKSCG